MKTNTIIAIVVVALLTSMVIGDYIRAYRDSYRTPYERCVEEFRRDEKQIEICKELNKKAQQDE